MHTQYPMTRTKLKQDFRNVCKCIKKEKLTYYVDISIQTLYSRLSWSTFGTDCSLESSWVWRDKLCTPGCGDFLPFFSTNPLKLCQVRVQARALAGPLNDIHRVVPKPILHCLGCVFRVIILLEGEPSARSEVLCALDQVFIKDISVLCSVQLSLNPESPSSCR